MSPTTLEPPGPIHQTGERPVVITEKARFSWAILLVVAGGAMTAAGGLAMARDASDCCRTASAELHRHELRIQRVEDAQSSSARSVEKIEATLREMNEKLDTMRGAR